MIHTNLPPRDALKVQAKRLRSTLAEQGTAMPHAAALETIAKQWGYRDWNTLSAAAQIAPTPRWQIGQRVTGRYLGHSFSGHIKSVNQKGNEHAQLTVVFDKPVDVVASDKFSSLRRQITAIVNGQGRTIEKTSNGQPHLVLN